jgi:hypothetical protein
MTKEPTRLTPAKKISYDKLGDEDLIRPIVMFLRESANYHIGDDGKVHTTMWGVEPDTPWSHNSSDSEKDCGLWHNIMFDLYGFIPTPCMECWKLVVAIDTVEQLFDMDEMQAEMDYFSKCGIEVRDYVSRLYGAYFYNDSLDEGQERYHQVIDAMEKRPILAPLLEPKDEDGYPRNVILKRACTEFERKFPKSNNWVATEEQVEMEKKILDLFDRDFPLSHQLPNQKHHVYRKWIEFAASHSDKTYLKFTDNKPLLPPPVTYHKLDLTKVKKVKQHNSYLQDETA